MPIKVDDPTDIQSAYDDLGGTSLHKAETAGADGSHDQIPVSYTHLTLPTSDLV